MLFETAVDLLSNFDLLLLILAGTCIGLFFGIVPGLGGKLGIIFLIPFVFGMETIPGVVFLLAMHAVVHTSGAIPSIVFGIPGTGPDAATIVDGFPMAQRGEAARAIGATLMASAVGGVLGALFLSLFLPIASSVVLAFSPAEFFFMAIFGLTFIAALSGNDLMKGLIVGLFGLLLSCVGLDPQDAQERFTFGFLELQEGIDPVLVVVAFYGFPEIVELVAKPRSAARASWLQGQYRIGLAWQGCMDVFRHRWLTLRTSVIGAFIGLIPGLGGDVATWLCYAHAVQSSRTPEKFGKGAVEGVIAPETANNSKEGGALVPTLFFGVPGSSGMAILMGAFVMLGLQPGPGFAATSSDLAWLLVWTLAISNILAAFLSLMLVPWLGLLASVRLGLLLPFIIVLSLVGVQLSAGNWLALLLAALLGIIGLLFRNHDWPRAPLIVGLILGPIAEDSLHKSLALWGPSFALRPLSLLLIFLTLLSILGYVLKRRRLAKS